MTSRASSSARSPPPSACWRPAAASPSSPFIRSRTARSRNSCASAARRRRRARAQSARALRPAARGRADRGGAVGASGMIRLGTALWLLLVAASGYAMFQIKYEVVKLEDELTRINRQIVAGRESTRVLGAEWSFLNQPDRLDRLAKRYLSLGPIATAQLGTIDTLPRRSPVPPAAVAVAAPPPATSRPAAASWLAGVPSEVPQ